MYDPSRTPGDGPADDVAVCASVAANIFNFLHFSFFFIALPSFFLPLPSSSSLAGHVTFAKSIKVRALQRFKSVGLGQSVESVGQYD